MSQMQVGDLTILVYELDRFEDLINVRLERVYLPDGNDWWAIREGGFCLNKQGKWEFETIASSRTEDFYERCRFDSADEALSFWQRSGCKSRFEKFRTESRKHVSVETRETANA